MGHVFSYCHMDFVARYQMMQQKQLLYPFCFDSNGLPTEKLAQQSGFYESPAIINFAESASKPYRELFSDIGMGYSSHHYHTFTELAVKLAHLSFEDLCQKGLAYKAEAEYFYCPKTGVSVSQSEVDDTGCYERSGVPVITKTGTGWFIKIKERLPEIRQAIDTIQWYPESFKHRLHRWLDDIRFEWSISRERKHGIPIPGEPGLVFDTWFTSSLSPQLAWASHTGVASLACPIFDARFQAHDIIRTWALFTIIKSLYHNNQVPWKSIIISGHALDKHGKKISKTLGNFVPPQEYLKNHGKNGVRYWAAQNQHGTDTRTDIQLMDKGRKLINKIKNARRFIAMKNQDITSNIGVCDDLTTEWLEQNKKLHTLMSDFNWGETIHQLTDYFWHRFCDYWIERGKKEPLSTSLHTTMEAIISWYQIFFPDLLIDIAP